ncbi:MAG TPA: cation diffusion facilitator family transporter [Chitinophagaceae bacterium]|nr:cation diffusion facilitator family transporter [Chitinophagaceae bacterium]
MGHEHHHHSTQNIRLAFLVNTLFAVVELFGGLLTNSVAILSDALHDFGDSLSLGLAWYLQKKSAQPGNATYTYGYKRFSLLAALINAIVLAVGSVFVIAEAVERLRDPQQPDAKGMLLLAVLGLAFNGFAMLRLRRGRSISERVVSLHFLEDILGWLAVLLGALVMMVYDVPILDPLLSLGIACFILFNVYRNLKPALKIVLQGIPDAAQEAAIRATILNCDKVSDIHDFRMWSLDGEHSVVSLHAVVSEDMSLKQAEYLKEKIKTDLLQHEVAHATIEIEYAPEHG